MFTKIKLILASIVAVIGVVLAAFLKGRSNGVKSTENKMQEQHNKDVEQTSKERVENIKNVSGVKQEAIVNSDSKIDTDLNDKWTRG